jgi:hypothetical protein
MCCKFVCLSTKIIMKLFAAAVFLLLNAKSRVTAETGGKFSSQLLVTLVQSRVAFVFLCFFPPWLLIYNYYASSRLRAGPRIFFLSQFQRRFACSCQVLSPMLLVIVADPPLHFVLSRHALIRHSFCLESFCVGIMLLHACLLHESCLLTSIKVSLQKQPWHSFVL